MVSELFERDVYAAIRLKTCVNGRKVYGGPAEKNVKEQIKLMEEFITRHKRKEAD